MANQKTKEQQERDKRDNYNPSLDDYLDAGEKGMTLPKPGRNTDRGRLSEMGIQSSVAMRPLIAKMKAKFAELDTLDNEFAALDAITPEGEAGAKFDLLSEKREEL